MPPLGSPQNVIATVSTLILWNGLWNDDYFPPPKRSSAYDVAVASSRGSLQYLNCTAPCSSRYCCPWECSALNLANQTKFSEERLRQVSSCGTRQSKFSDQPSNLPLSFRRIGTYQRVPLPDFQEPPGAKFVFC